MSASGAHASLVPFMLHASLTALLAAVSGESGRKCRNRGGEGRGCVENSSGEKKEEMREQIQESINEEEPLCCVDRVQYQLGLPEAITQLQKSIPCPFTPVPCWWHLRVSVLRIYMHSRVGRQQQPAHLTWRAPLCS